MVPSHRLRLRLVAPSAVCWPLGRYSRAIVRSSTSLHCNHIEQSVFRTGWIYR